MSDFFYLHCNSCGFVSMEDGESEDFSVDQYRNHSSAYRDGVIEWDELMEVIKSHSRPCDNCGSSDTLLSDRDESDPDFDNMPDELDD